MEWRTLQLGELLDCRNGLWAGKDGEFTRAKVIRVTEMRDNGTYDLSTAKELQVEARKLTTRKVVPNSILLERSGGGENKPVGRVILFGDDVLDDVYSFSNFTTLLIPKADLVTPKYLFYFAYFFHLSGKTKNLQKAVTGIRNLEFSKYLEQEVSVPFKDNKPDLAEQKRITDKLDKVFMEIEKSVDKVKQNKKYASKTTYSELLTTFSDENLKIYSLEDVCDTTSGGTPSRSNSAYYDGDISWLKSGELNDNRSISSSEEHISEDAIKKSNAKVFPSGTVLLAMYGATVGKLGILSASASTNQAVCAITPYKNILNEYMFWYLYFYRDELVKKAFGGAQPNISQTLIRKLPIKVPLKDNQPDPAKQKEIVARVNAIQEKQEKLTGLFSRQEKLFASLRSSVLSYAFQSEKVVASVSIPVLAPRMFDIQQAVAQILKRFERGEMVVAKVLYLGQALFGVPTNIQFSAQNFGPYDAAVKKAVTAGLSPRNMFFTRKGSGSNQVLALGTNANKILKYSTSVLARKTNVYLEQMMPLFSKSDSAGIERLATICKIIEDEQTVDEAVVKVKLQEWKPNKFTDEEVSRTLAFIKNEGWEQKLLK